METDLDLIPGLTETAPDTEPVTARLEEMLAGHAGRAQDSLQAAIENLHMAYKAESNKRVKSNIEEALEILRHGDEDEDEDSTTLHEDE